MHKVIFALLFFALTGCEIFKAADVQIQKMNPNVNYERDMVVCVNGFCKAGSVTMPLLDTNEIRVYGQGPLDIFVTTTCGGRFKQQNAGNVKTIQKSFWSKKEVTKSNEAVFTILKSDFHQLGKICPLYLSGIANNGRHSDAFVNWQTDDFKLSGQLVCQMEKRAFEGVEACDTGAQSLTKISFDEEVKVRPEPGCDFGVPGTKTGREFTWQVKSGECHYAFIGSESDVKGVYTTYGADEITVR